MRPRILIPLFLLGSACSSAPPVPMKVVEPREDRKTFWIERTRTIRSGWGRIELVGFLEELRTPPAHTPGTLNGGGFSVDGGPITFFDLYSLDEEWMLYVVWNDQDVLKGIRSTEVVGLPDLRSRIDPDLYDAVAAIHRSPSGQSGLGFSPIRLLRAVNALQALGREKALKALRAYERLSRSVSSEETQKYFIDEYRILPIAQILFDGAPPYPLGGGDVAAPGPSWPKFPLILVQELPFMIVSGYVLVGIPPEAGDYLARIQGSMRSQPLSPRVTPLEAADELVKSPAWSALELGPGHVGRKRWEVRRQALEAAGKVFTPREDETTNQCCVDPTEEQWGAMVERARASGAVWSPELQDFVLGR